MSEIIKQEYAAIQKFIIECFDCIHPYFENIPQEFACPAVFFPAPEMTSTRETTESFSLSIFADILFFAGDSNEAMTKSSLAAINISKKQCKIPVYDIDGNPTGEVIRTETPEVSKVEEGTYKLHVSWTSKIAFEENTEKNKAKNINFVFSLS